jgi:hypothetical protein
MIVGLAGVTLIPETGPPGITRDVNTGDKAKQVEL